MSSTSTLHGPRSVVTVEDRDHSVARRGKTLTRKRRQRGVLWAFVAMMGCGLIFLGATGTGGQPAQAIDLFCVENNSQNSPSAYGAGMDAVVPRINPVTGGLSSLGFNSHDAPYGTTHPVTAYEWFGGAGMSMSAYYGDKGERGDPCFPVSEVMGNFIANTLFMYTTTIVGLVIGLFQWASAPSLFQDFLVPITRMIKGTDGNSGLDDQLFLPFFTPLVMLGALWMGWKGLVKSRTSEAVQGAVWMICAGAFALFFMAQPTLIASWSDQIVSSITAVATSATTSTVAKSTPQNDICYLPDGAPSVGPRTASCAIWKAMLFTPWSTAQFGLAPTNDLKATLDTKVGSRTMNDLRVAQMDAQSFNHDESLAITPEMRKAKTAKWEQILDLGTTKSWWGSWNGSDPGQRTSLAGASLMSGLIGGALIAVISFTILTLQLFNLLLILTGPLFLLIGVHPGFGRKIGLKWLELVVSTVLKRVALGFMLAVLIAMYQIILTAPMAWFAQVVMMFAVGVGFFMFRKPMLAAFAQSVNFGGQSIGAGTDPKRSAKRFINQGVGAGVGGFAARKAGGGLGGVIQGAVQGGSRGGRSPSVFRAASIGGSAGRRQGAQSASKRARKDNEDLEKDGIPDDDRDEDFQREGEERENDKRDKESQGRSVPRPDSKPGGSSGSGSGSGSGSDVPRPDGDRPSGGSDGSDGSDVPRPGSAPGGNDNGNDADNADDDRDRADRRGRDDKEAADRRERDNRERADREARDSKEWRDQQEVVRNSTAPSEQLRRAREAASAAGHIPTPRE